MATEDEILIYEHSKEVKKYSNLKNNFINKSGMPMGFFQSPPEIHKFPFLTCSGTQGITLINLDDAHNYSETLIPAESDCAWGQ